jgi:uncharacterized membrane protein YphA (DoxX/SURF4 family)
MQTAVTVAAPASPAPWRHWFLLAGRLALGALFLFAAGSKLRHPWLLFTFTIDSYQMHLPLWAVNVLARTIPWLELLLGLILISGWMLRWACVAACAAIAIFLAALTRAYAMGLHIDCGCFGPGERLGPASLVRDACFLGFAVLLTVLAFQQRRRFPAAD